MNKWTKKNKSSHKNVVRGFKGSPLRGFKGSPLRGFKGSPLKWNKDKYIRNSHNCYAYFLDKIDKSAVRHCHTTYHQTKRCKKPQPGFYRGITEKRRRNYRCPNMIQRVKLDNPDVIYQGRAHDFVCPARHYEGALVRTTKPTKKCNYHFYRQHQNRRWSHKDGAQPATDRDAKGKPIADPKHADRKYPGCNYDQFCGYFCVPQSSRKKHMRHINKKTASGGSSKTTIPNAISQDFPSGNIKVVTSEPHHVLLELERDPYLNIYKNKYDNWFYFRVDNMSVDNMSVDTSFTIQNIRTYAACQPSTNDWVGFHVCYSYDNKTWHRITTTTDCGDSNKKTATINWQIMPTKPTMWFAYYVPYPFSKTQKLFKHAETIARTVEGRPILLQRYGHGPTKVWLISGQHPGETIHAWILEGFVKRLLERKHELFPKYTFYIVPNANPDGNVLGYTRVNASGTNMNRDWAETKSPEIKGIKHKMDELGFDLVFDLHGDEGARKHFFTSSHNPKHPWHDKILRALMQKNAQFQFKDHYKPAYIKSMADGEMTLDEFSGGITIEGAMKHSLYDHATLQDEPLLIGRELADILKGLAPLKPHS